MNKLQGVLGRRITRTQKRLLSEDCPTFTSAFILADVQAKDQTNRRFSQFSGDLSGRFLGALSLLPAKGTDRLLKRLAAEILRQQRTDGRFGDPDLDFYSVEIDKDHMPLLWGNGRLLVGLLEYHSRFSDENALSAAIRLGDFISKVSKRCLKDEIAEKLIAQGAAGFICFTQCNEGLVLLAQATGDSRHLETAKLIAPWILPRGQQHTHGYLTTLRGVLMLHESTKDKKLLSTAEKLFAGLVSSSDYLPAGGVPEYFNWRDDPLNKNEAVAAHSTSEPRDEGCSEADFLRLCLQLWKSTAKIEYLEKAEHCTLNHLLSNQFPNGDFGHRHLSTTGFKPYPRPGRAWWCCTMHALRAFKDIESAAVTKEKHSYFVNLFVDCDVNDDLLQIKFRQEHDRSSMLHRFTAAIIRAKRDPITLALREADWAKTVSVRVNGKPVKFTRRNGYIRITRQWKSGDQLQFARSYNIRVQLQDRHVANFKDYLAAPETGVTAIYYGPWLLGIHGAVNQPYFSEPSWNNVISLPASEAKLKSHWRQPKQDESKGYLRVSYFHEGFPGKLDLSLQPICYQANFDDQILEIFFKSKRDEPIS